MLNGCVTSSEFRHNFLNSRLNLKLQKLLRWLRFFIIHLANSLRSHLFKWSRILHRLQSNIFTIISILQACPNPPFTPLEKISARLNLSSPKRTTVTSPQILKCPKWRYPLLPMFFFSFHDFSLLNLANEWLTWEPLPVHRRPKLQTQIPNHLRTPIQPAPPRRTPRAFRLEL